MKNKKAQQAQGAIAAVISLIVGVGTAVLVLVFVGVLGGQAYDISEDDIESIADNTVTHDTLTVLNNTAVHLDHNDIQVGTLSLYNVSSPTVEWGLLNFTIDYDTGSVLLRDDVSGAAGSVPLNNSALAANYTWGAAEVRNSVQNSIISGFNALEDTGNYLPLIVLGIVIFIVLGLVLGMTAFTRQGGSGIAL